MTSNEAIDTARDDVLTALGTIAVAPQGLSLSSLNIYSAVRDDLSSAYLVTISALFVTRANQLSASNGTSVTTELQGLLDTVAGDLGDGVADDVALIDGVRIASADILNPVQVVARLDTLALNEGETLFAGNIQLFLDNDLDGLTNDIDTDDDNDGVDDAIDAFPWDPSEQIDTDGDGVGDNADADDDGDGIDDVDDAYPLDSACYRPEDGDGNVCDIEATLSPAYSAASTAVNNAGIVYLLSNIDGRIVRWSIPEQRYLFSLIMPAGARTIAFSETHYRIYVGFDSGEVIAIDPSGRHEQTSFATPGSAVSHIVAVGDYLLVIDSDNMGYTLDFGGNPIDQWDFRSPLVKLVWNDSAKLLHFSTRGNSDAFDNQEIRALDGTFGSRPFTRNTDGFYMRGPFRMSDSGNLISTASGDLFSSETYEWQRSLPGQFQDVAVHADDSISSIRVDGANTQFERRDSRGAMVEYTTYPGNPVRLVSFGDDTQVITQRLQPTFNLFVSGGDIDDDTVANANDAFPDDLAASVDSDGDGYPDDWNPGRSGADSTTGLILDSYPNDSACFLPAHGDGVTCDIAGNVPPYIPEWVVSDVRGVVHLLDSDSSKIYRWDTGAGHLNPIIIGGSDGGRPDFMRYSLSQDRLYIAYDTGKISYFDLAGGGRETYLASTSTIPRGLEAAGAYVWTVFRNAYSTGRFSTTFDAAGEVGARFGTGSQMSSYSAWNETLDRVYHFRDGISPPDIHYQSVDQASGALVRPVDSPYHGDYTISPPIRMSQDDALVVIGSGDIYQASDLSWAGAIQRDFVDAQWLDQGEIVAIYPYIGRTRLARFNASGAIVEALQYSGRPLAIVPSGNDQIVITNRGQPQFLVYTPSNDTDGDGIDNATDAFPTDPAASVDSDFDGYPDDWNPGMTAADSTTGLTLDAYPNDSACFLPGHGDGVSCDIAARIPAYVPASVAIDGSGVIYLHSPNDSRVFRWDSVTQEHLNPLLIGSRKWLNFSPPTLMTYQETHFRLYFGYGSGDITYIDLADQPDERYLTTLAQEVRGIADAGNFLLALDSSGSSARHYIYDDAGILRDNVDRGRFSRSFDWNASLSRIYFFRDATSPNDLHYEDIDPMTGTVTASGETPYHGTYAIIPPIRVSADNTEVLLGSGDIYNAVTLNWIDNLPSVVTDAAWLNDGRLVSVRSIVTDTLFETYDAAHDLQASSIVTGSPIACFEYNGNVVVVTDLGQPQFTIVSP